MKKVTWVIIVLIIVALGAFYYYHQSGAQTPATTATTADTNETPIADATYTCDKGHSIHATYFEGTTTTPVQPGQPPVPTGSVQVSLDGGPTMTLAQTISADGARYSDGNPQIAQGQPGAETFVFWNKGNSALIMRNNTMDLTYTNCTATTTAQ